MVTLLAFIEDRFGLRVPDEEVKPEHFKNLDALSNLLVRLSQGGAASATDPDAPVHALEQRGVRSAYFTPATGESIHFLATPRREGRPRWLILPAIGSPASDWGVILRNLVGVQEAVAIDWAGFGLSTMLREAPGFAAQGVAALALFDQMIAERDEPIVVIGHGFGALLAIEVARARPAATKALVAVGFGESSTVDGAAVDGTHWSTALMDASDATSFVERRHYTPGTLSQAARRRIDEALAAPAWRAFLDEEAASALRQGFSRLSLPTLLVMGEGDRLVPHAAAEEVVRRVPGARLEWLARCGHAVPVERPQELLLMINLFLYQRSK